MKKKKPEIEDIKDACAWTYQVVAALLCHIDPKIGEDEQVEVLDILSAIASGCKIPHKKRWRLK